MAKVYADLIRKGKKTLDDVPEKLKAEVKAILVQVLLLTSLTFFSPIFHYGVAISPRHIII